MTGTWIESNVPTLARVGRRGWPWALTLAVTYVVAGLAATAARWRVGQLLGSPDWEFERTVWPHAASVTLVVWLALAISVPLLRARLFAVASAVCAGAAFGPLRLVAPPTHGDLEFVDQSPSLTQAAWPIAVAAALTLVLVSVAQGLARRDPALDVPRGPLIGVAGIGCLGLGVLLPPLIPEQQSTRATRPGCRSSW